MLTKSEFVSFLAARTALSLAKTERFMGELFDLIQTELTSSDGGECNIPGFGKFSVIATAERQGRNPQTGAPITIPAKKKIRFAPSAALKRRING